MDDGSTDGTWERLVVLKQFLNELRIVKLRTNFGQTRALALPPELAQAISSCYDLAVLHKIAGLVMERLAPQELRQRALELLRAG